MVNRRYNRTKNTKRNTRRNKNTKRNKNTRRNTKRNKNTKRGGSGGQGKDQLNKIPPPKKYIVQANELGDEEGNFNNLYGASAGIQGLEESDLLDFLFMYKNAVPEIGYTALSNIFLSGEGMNTADIIEAMKREDINNGRINGEKEEKARSSASVRIQSAQRGHSSRLKSKSIKEIEASKGWEADWSKAGPERYKTSRGGKSSMKGKQLDRVWVRAWDADLEPDEHVL